MEEIKDTEVGSEPVDEYVERLYNENELLIKMVKKLLADIKQHEATIQQQQL